MNYLSEFCTKKIDNAQCRKEHAIQTQPKIGD